MGFIGSLFGKTKPPREYDGRLIGQWKLDRSEMTTKRDPSVKSEFMIYKDNGELEYLLDFGEKMQIMKLTYYVLGDTIVSNQPSHPREEKTKYYFDSHGKLVLDYQNRKSWYTKVILFLT
jgi:hypothetical protein